jgi:probable H4MPT-linked C1 transfer pathway protein
VTATTCIGWDIGGAHLKMARLAPDGSIQAAAQYATPLWQGLQSLHDEFEKISRAGSMQDARHGLTMTGELVDLFPDRRAGVDALLHAFVRHFPEQDTAVFAGRAGFLPVAGARIETTSVASANWLATALCAATQVEHGILVDVGSTTTDIIPIAAHQPCNLGWNDQQRLAFDELLYTGIVRTPVMALVQRVPFDGRWQNVAAEYFATAADVYRVTGDLDEGSDLHETADRRGKTAAESVARLARMLGTEAGAGDVPDGRWVQLAAHIAEQQLLLIARALVAVHKRMDAGTPVTIIGAGAGAWLAQKLARRQRFDYLDFADLFADGAASARDIATCAPAVAVAELVRRMPVQ